MYQLNVFVYLGNLNNFDKPQQIQLQVKNVWNVLCLYIPAGKFRFLTEKMANFNEMLCALSSRISIRISYLNRNVF
jgi:hypothetical protein